MKLISTQKVHKTYDKQGSIMHYLSTNQQFLGHAGFYRRFIKDFSKIAKPLYKLLEKDAKFAWERDCQKSYEEMRSHLTTAPIVWAPNW